MGSDVSTFFPEDVIAFAKSLKEKIKIGAYTASLGHPELRKTIAAGIEKRDGHAASIDTPQECVVLSSTFHPASCPTLSAECTHSS